MLAEAAGRPAFVAYADCGTGGGLDAMLARHPGVARLPGAHCYEVFAGSALFAELDDAEPGTFFLTDFLARHFEALVWQGLGLDRHPELLADVLRQLPPRRPAQPVGVDPTSSSPAAPPPSGSGSTSSTVTSAATGSPRRSPSP